MTAKVRPAAPGALEELGARRREARRATAHPVDGRRPGDAPSRRQPGRALEPPCSPASDRKPAVLSLRRRARRRVGRAAAASAARAPRDRALPRQTQGRDARPLARRAPRAVRLRRSPGAGRRARGSRKAPTCCACSACPSAGGPRRHGASPSACARWSLESCTSCEPREAADEHHRAGHAPPREPVRARPRTAPQGGRDVRRRPEPDPGPRGVQKDRRGVRARVDGRRDDARVRGVSGRAQRHARAGEGRHPLPPGRDP